MKTAGQKLAAPKTSKAKSNLPVLTTRQILEDFLTDEGKLTLTEVSSQVDIDPFIIASLVPDLIDYINSYEAYVVVDTVNKSNPENPPSFIFNSLYQEVHESTLKIEQELLTNDYEAEEGLIPCPKCKSKKVRTTQVQTRSADEPATLFNYCTICKNKWSRSAA